MQPPAKISVVVEQTGAGLMRATSPDMRELHVVGATADEAKTRAKAMVQDICAAYGHTVSVGSAPDQPDTFVIAPV